MKILTIASGEGATKTSLVYESNLNFVLIQKYIALLQGKGLLDTVQTHHGSTIYKTTKTGSEALEALRSAINLVFDEATTTTTPFPQ